MISVVTPRGVLEIFRELIMNYWKSDRTISIVIVLG